MTGQPFSPSWIRVRVGAHDLRVNEANAKTISVTRITIHPEYHEPDSNNDFAVLKLAEPLTFNNHVSPICLVDPADGAQGTQCYVTGFGVNIQYNSTGRHAPVGRNGEKPGLQSRLRQASVRITEQLVCEKVYGDSSLLHSITPEMICASAPGNDSCHGDSGGPLVCQANPEEPFKLVGVVSWGYGCADARYPGVCPRLLSLSPVLFLLERDRWDGRIICRLKYEQQTKQLSL